jgi:hypothetical protein
LYAVAAATSLALCPAGLECLPSNGFQPASCQYAHVLTVQLTAHCTCKTVALSSLYHSLLPTEPPLYPALDKPIAPLADQAQLLIETYAQNALMVRIAQLRVDMCFHDLHRYLCRNWSY